MKDIATLDKSTRYGLIALALTQGYALYFLQLALKKNVWPVTDAPWLAALYTLAIGLPVFFYLGMEQLRDRRNLGAALVMGGLLLWLGHHLGWVQSYAGLTSNSRFLFNGAFVVSVGIALCVVALFFRLWSANGRLVFDYQQLLSHAWQQTLTLELSALFVASFWLLLLLWMGLFKAIGIDYFADLFSEPAFYYPVSWLALGLGLVMIRQRPGLLTTLRHLGEIQFKALLPLVALIEMLFLASLLFTGLAPIWGTGHAALLMMVLAFLLLSFFNAVMIKSSQDLPYSSWVRGLLLLALALLPVYALLSGWALWLRIEQYGLTLDRLWAAVILLLIASVTFIYALLVIIKRGRSLGAMAQANKWLALLLVVVLVLVNSPLADLRAWAAQGQINRLLAGKVAVAAFDYNYLRFSLGRPGVEALRDLQQSDFAKQHPDAASRIALALSKQKRWEQKLKPETAKDLGTLLTVVPAGTHLPETLLRKLTEEPLPCMQANGKCLAYQVRIGSAPGWILMDSELFGGGAAYLLQAGTWLRLGRVDINCRTEAGSSLKRRLSATAWRRLNAPFLSYTDGNCFYSVVPSLSYLQQLQSR